MDVATLRAELKAWERDFRNEHSRNPTIEEIKDQPAIAAKYKLYKSLSKSATSSSIAKSSTARSSTPPRSQSRRSTHTSTSSLLPKARAVKVGPPIQTTNPFSPVKKKPRSAHLDSPPTASSTKLSEHDPHINPFTTPTKTRSSTKSKPSAPLPSAATRTPSGKSAVTRARKRLRGEPVSPSPVKEKRARVGSQRALNFSSTLQDSDDEDAQQGHTVGAADETFLEATPMKPPPGGKSFRVLFDEVLPTAQEASRQPTTRTLSRTMSAAPKPNGLSNKRARTRAMSPSSSEDEGDNWGNGTKLESLITSANGFHRKRLPNGSDDLRSEKAPLRGSVPKGPLPRGKTPTGSVDASGAARLNGKRPRPDARDDSIGIDIANGLGETNDVDHTAHSRTSIANDKGKGKAAAAFSRKKARLLEQLGGDGVSDDSTDSEEDNDQEVSCTSHELDDPEFEWPARPAHPPDSPSADPPVIEGAVDLANAVLYGRRESHFDAKGMEVWDVGEMSEGAEGAGEDGEDDWEGEPIPWEVGEL
ncbi:DNA replication and checkpoint protein-domain-containing protein [Fomitopsis serialis]|uniref:DNA replication and checkpoint protein-domain-containing protein n=1 Tax=Fomitopsis serialis TaxID=139415 RepID=UPI002008A69D|nr:DNA replication and checkpoint protein-domain-containing protein [Neoantrodia serialis]KAH9937232.1 DNA replication and checkpoint protein-domain-containing protein [Neoantrodia serialis]